MPSVVGGQNMPIQMEISGTDLEVLDQLALKAQRFAIGTGGYMDPDTTVRTGKPEIRVTPARPVLADLGLPANALGMTLRANLEGLEAATFKRNARNYDIVVTLAEQDGSDQVGQFLFPGTPGRPVLLDDLGSVSSKIAPVQITRKDKRRISKLFSGLASSKPLGNAVAELGTFMKAEADMPPGYKVHFAGDAEYMAEAQTQMGEAALIAIILVILTLAAILESFRQPVAILVTLPLALIGMFWALYATGESMSMFVLMGAVMLIGIVVNNAILIMDQMNTYVSQGAPRHGAMVRASMEKFRPIVMITLAAVLGMMPMAIGRGIGAELRNGVGIASVGGIAVSGALTLIVLPILYDLFTRRGGGKKDDAADEQPQKAE